MGKEGLLILKYKCPYSFKFQKLIHLHNCVMTIIWTSTISRCIKIGRFERTCAKLFKINCILHKEFTTLQFVTFSGAGTTNRENIGYYLIIVNRYISTSQSHLVQKLESNYIKAFRFLVQKGYVPRHAI